MNRMRESASLDFPPLMCCIKLLRPIIQYPPLHSKLVHPPPMSRPRLVAHAAALAFVVCVGLRFYIYNMNRMRESASLDFPPLMCCIKLLRPIIQYPPLHSKLVHPPTMSRPRLVAHAAALAFVVCVGLRFEYMQDLSSNLLYVSEKAMPLGNLNEEIRVLNQKVDNLQKRCVAQTRRRVFHSYLNKFATFDMTGSGLSPWSRSGSTARNIGWARPPTWKTRTK